MPQNRRARIAFVVFLMVVAAVSLVSLVARPRFLTYNLFDVIQTAGIGVCFGVALMVLIGTRKPVSVTV